MSILERTTPRSVAKRGRMAPFAKNPGGGGRMIAVEGAQQASEQTAEQQLEDQLGVNDKANKSPEEVRAQVEQHKNLNATRQQQMASLYGLKYDNWAESDVERFAKHRDVFAQKLKSGFYDEESGNGGYEQFLADLEVFGATYDSYSQAGSSDVINQRSALESAITDGFSDNNFELTDDVESLKEKDRIFNMGGVDTEGQQFNEQTMQWEGYYLDLQGNRMLREDGKPVFGPILDAPTRGKRELYSPSLTERGGMDPSDVAMGFIQPLFAKVNPLSGGGVDLESTLNTIREQLVKTMSDVESMSPADPMRNAVKTAVDEFEGSTPIEGATAITMYVDKVVEQLREMYNNKEVANRELYDPYNPRN